MSTALGELSASMARAIEALDEAARLARAIGDDELERELLEVGLLERVARRLENAAAQAELDRRSVAASPRLEELGS